MHVCCVITPETAPWATVSVRALLRHDPSASVHVLDPAGAWQGPSEVELLGTSDIGVDDRLLHEAAVLADTAPLAGWLLPRLVRAVVERHGSAVHLGPGMLPVASLAPVVAATGPAGVAVIARCASLPPDDLQSPAPADLQVAGPFHTALMAWDARAADILDEWIVLSDPGIVSPWQDAVALRGPELLPHTSVVSRWNVGPGSRVTRERDGWRLDGAEVLAVDLTNADARRPWLLSTIRSDIARTRLSQHPELAGLVAETAAEVRAATPDESPHLLDRTTGGLRVRGPVRRAYREALAVSRRSDAPPPPDPFDPSQAADFEAWLDAPAPTAPPLTRYLHALYLDRPDLRRRLPLVPGPDTTRFLGWVEAHARDEGGAARHVERGLELARTTIDTAPGGWHSLAARAAGRPEHPKGVNVVGYLRGELGIGEAARLSLTALRAADVPVTTMTVDTLLQSRQREQDAEAGGGDVVRATSLLCVNANQVGSVLESLPVLDRTTYRIGQWYWEVEDFPPAERGGFGHVDEVWVATDFVRDAVARHTRLPVLTMPPPLPQRGAPTTLTRADLGLPADRPVVLFSFDYLSTLERKNPLDLVEAFRRAFAPDEGPLLVLKSISSELRVDDAERLRTRVAGEPDILLLEDYLSPERRDALVQLSDVYASLHRSEGLGLTLAEAMAWGKPVVATAYSGNLHFMTDENSYLVPWTPTTIPAHCDPYPEGGTWAQPDLDVAARLLREAVEDTAGAAVRGARAAHDIREKHGTEEAGARMAARLAQIDVLVPRLRWRARARRLSHVVRRAVPGA